MKDVAKLAGVSLMTVSRVVNQSAPVDEATRAKVEDAIRKLRFRPNLFAKRLRQRHAEPNDPPHSLYAVYECYRECAKAGEPYPNTPGKNRRLGFASVFSAEPFGAEVEEDVCRQAKLAGFDKQNLIILDNKYDADIALKNAEVMLAQQLDVFIEYQADVKANHIIAAKFAEAGIPILAVDIPVPGAPFMGVHDWKAATLGGKYMAQLITEKWGGWEAVDLVVLLQMPVGGEITMLRSEGFATALEEVFGNAVEQKIVRADGGMGLAEQAKTSMSQVLAAHPNATRIALTSINEETMSGAIEAIQEAGRWQRDNLIIMTLGVDDLGKKQIREGLSDAGVAFFPEKYGEYLMPAACAILEGAPVPSHIFVENEIITQQNIDQFYPQS